MFANLPGQNKGAYLRKLHSKSSSEDAYNLSRQFWELYDRTVAETGGGRGMHTYLALLLMQESLFKSGLTTIGRLRDFKEHLRSIDDWREIRDKWIPYK